MEPHDYYDHFASDAGYGLLVFEFGYGWLEPIAGTV
jgi:hypothetical protein